MRIAISSRSGCGNTTVTRLVSEKLGYPMINFTFRQMAEERGMEFWAFCRLAENDYEIDKELDRRQVEMAMAIPDCVLGVAAIPRPNPDRLPIHVSRQRRVAPFLRRTALFETPLPF